MLSLKIPEFCSVDGAKSKHSVFRVFRVPFDYPVHSLQETALPMESRDSVGVLFASLEVTGRYRSPKGAEKWSRDHHEN